MAKLPPIPDPRTTPLARVLSAMKEWMEAAQGLKDGAAELGGGGGGGGAGGAGSGPGGLPGGTPSLDPAVPPKVMNLRAAGAVNTIIVTWDDIRGYSRLAYFEVWRADHDTLGDAVKVAQVFEPIYSDQTGPNRTYYYWVRAVSDAAIGPFNAQAGTMAATAMNVADVTSAIQDEINASGLLSQLTLKVDADGNLVGYGPASTPNLDGGTSTTFAILANRFVIAAPASSGIVPPAPFYVQTTPTTINGVPVPAGVYMDAAYIANGVIGSAQIGLLAVDDARISSVNAAKLTAGQLQVGAYIQSTNYQAGLTGFHIGGNGAAEFSNAIVRGTVYASAGLIGGAVLSASSVHSSNYSPGATGWILRNDGTAELNNGTSSLTVYGNNLIHGNAIVDNTLTAAKIDTRNLTVKDAAGNIILGAGVALDKSHVAGLGAFAGLSALTAGNVGTYIAGGAITNAYIGDTIQSWNYVSGSTGWTIQKSGFAEFDLVTVRRRQVVATGIVDPTTIARTWRLLSGGDPKGPPATYITIPVTATIGSFSTGVSDASIRNVSAQ